MECSNKYTKHFFMLSILFILGNACITLPVKNANKFNFLAFLVAAVASVAVGLLVYFIPLNKFTAIPVILLAFYCIADAFITFIRFISNNLLPNSPRVLIILPFGLILLYIAFQRVDMLLEFSLLCGIFVIAVVVLFFGATAKDFNVKNIYIYEWPKMNTLVNQIIPYIKSLVVPSVLLTLFGKSENANEGKIALGLAIGFISLGLCLLNSVLLFGIELSGILDYPYSSAGSTVTFGYLFTRLDGFLYFVYFATCVVKCGVGIFVIKKSRETLCFP